jgi:amidase
VPDYLANLNAGESGLRVGIDHQLISVSTDVESLNVTEHAATVLTHAGAVLKDIIFPSPIQVVRDAYLLCAVEAAVTHKTTYPTRAADYGTVLASFLEMGRAVGGPEVSDIWVRRLEFRGHMDMLFRDIDILIVPVSNRATLSLTELAESGRSPPVMETRTRFTAPFNMSGYPTLTLPGGMTKEGLPVGFQLVARPMEEALLLRVGHAFQQETDWHRRRPPAPFG